MLDPQTLKERIALIEDRRESLVKLLEQPDLGTLRIDVNQALEELDDLRRQRLEKLAGHGPIKITNGAVGVENKCTHPMLAAAGASAFTDGYGAEQIF